MQLEPFILARDIQTYSQLSKFCLCTIYDGALRIYIIYVAILYNNRSHNENRTS